MLLVCGLQMLAQEPPRPPIDLQTFAENIFPLQDEDLPYEELYENLLQYVTQPLDLNQADRETLQSLYILTPQQIEGLLRHIERNGPLLSLYELQAVPSLDLHSIQRLLPFVRVKDLGLQGDLRPLRQRILTDGTRFALLRWERIPERQAGFTARSDSLNPAFGGSPDKLYFRLRMSKARSFSMGLTAEKDAGEQLRLRPRQGQWGADFYSFHLMLWNQGPFKRIALGDYQLQYGQGLVLGAGFYLGKGSETITTVARPSLGIRPYTSVVESGFFRGVAATAGNERGEFSLFAGRTPRDARLRAAADSLPEALQQEALYFSSIQTSGLHRTPAEFQSRNKLRETTFGAAGQWRLVPGKLSLGFTSLYTRFSHRQEALPRLYNQFAFRGKENFTASLFAEGYWQQLSYFSEWARSSGGGWGTVNGLMLPLSHSLDLSLLYRYYSRNFYSFYGAAFAEGSRLQNEGGLYWGLKFRPAKALWFTAYFDYFWFPWLRYRLSAPSAGYEYLLRANWQPNKQLLLYGQYRGEYKERDIASEEKGTVQALGIRHHYLLNLEFSPDKHWQIRSRAQGSQYQLAGNTSRGFVLVQDLSYAYASWRLSSRYALFQTDDWESRQYVFERDVLWAFSVPAYYGRGTRYYIMLQWKASQNLSFWLRWARTSYRDRDSIGNGLDKINGNTRSNIKLQLKLDF